MVRTVIIVGALLLLVSLPSGLAAREVCEGAIAAGACAGDHTTAADPRCASGDGQIATTGVGFASSVGIDGGVEGYSNDCNTASGATHEHGVVGGVQASGHRVDAGWETGVTPNGQGPFCVVFALEDLHTGPAVGCPDGIAPNDADWGNMLP